MGRGGLGIALELVVDLRGQLRPLLLLLDLHDLCVVRYGI